MPLIPGKAHVGQNIEEMVHTGHPHDQAVAAAMSVLRRGRAEGLQRLAAPAVRKRNHE